MQKRSLDEIEWDISRGQSHITAFLEELGALEKERVTFLRGTRFSCPDCGRRSTLSKWVFTQHLFYIHPIGHNSGDGWEKRPPNECEISCPKCKGKFYIHEYPQKAKLLGITERIGPDFHKLFNSVENMHDEYD